MVGNFVSGKFLWTSVGMIRKKIPPLCNNVCIMYQPNSETKRAAGGLPEADGDPG